MEISNFNIVEVSRNKLALKCFAGSTTTAAAGAAGDDDVDVPVGVPGVPGVPDCLPGGVLGVPGGVPVWLT